MATGNDDADAVNQHFTAGVSLLFQGMWDIIAPWLAAGVVLAIAIRYARSFWESRGRR